MDNEKKSKIALGTTIVCGTVTITYMLINILTAHQVIFLKYAINTGSIALLISMIACIYYWIRWGQDINAL